MARYCIFSAQYIPHVGGIERYTERLSKALVSRGHEVDVVTNNTEGMEHVVSEGGLTVIRLPCIPLFNGRLPLPRLNKTRKKLLEWIEGRSYDGILINARFYPHSLLGMRIACKQGHHPIVLDHGSDYLTFGNKAADILVRAYEHAITALGKAYNPRYFGVSDRSLHWLRHFGIEGEGVLPNSIDARRYRDGASSREFRCEAGIEDKDLLVAYVGRLIPEKGITALLQAAKECKLQNSRIRFIVAGEGPLERAVCSTGDNLSYVGRLSQPEVSALLMQSDVFCLPSRSEGFATCLLEAGACGTPAIATDVGGAREVMPNGSYGIILESSSVDEIATALLWCANHRAELREMGNKVQARIDSAFSWDETAERFERIVRSEVTRTIR